jgi:uncharacterized membrane protein YkoI
MKRSIKVVFFVGALSTVGAGAYASKTVENDALSINQAGISLTQAVQAAEQQLHGKAVKAEFEQSKKHGWIYDVEVVADNKTYEVAVDATKGTILAAQEDKADRDHGEDKED